jgi:hypothetical protein
MVREVLLRAVKELAIRRVRVVGERSQLRCALRATSAVLCSGNPGIPVTEDRSMYEKPTLERLGRVREVTFAGGMVSAGDAANPFHRYT